MSFVRVGHNKTKLKIFAKRERKQNEDCIYAKGIEIYKWFSRKADILVLGAECNAGRHKYISQLKALRLTATGNIFAAPDQYLLWWKNNAPTKKSVE